MKIVKLTFVAAVMLAATAFSACSSESEVTKAPKTEKASNAIVFNISLPTGDPFVFTRGIYNQDDSEAKLNSLRMFEFYADTEVLVATTDIDPTNDLTPTAGTYEWTYEPANPYTDSRARRFIFIANDDISLNANETITDLMAKLATQSLANDDPDANIWNSTALPMTGEAITGESNVIPIDLTEDAPTTVNVDLTRAVARIDVVNFTPKLEITGLKLVKMNPKSYILPHLDNSGKVVVPNGMTKVNNITPYRTYENNGVTLFRIPDTKIQTNGTVLIADTLHLNKAFYLYEEAEPADEVSALHLQVTGVLQGVDVFYNIPFWKSYLKESPSDDPLEIKRNHIYTVYIGDGSKPNINTSIRMAISVKDWKRQNVTDNFDDDIFKNNSTDAGVTNYERATQTFTLSNAAIASDFGIKVSDDYTNIKIDQVEVLTGETWLTATRDDNANISLTAAANTDAAVRIGSIRVTYTITPTTGSATQHKTVFSFKQAAGS